jgi:phosphoglycolate phosphatase-like HAD superfamily hydrolase
VTVTAETGEEQPELRVNPESVDLQVGDNQALTVTYKAADGEESDVTTEASYSVEDSTIATVDQGLVTGVAEGTTTITVTHEGLTKTVQVTVIAEGSEEPEPGELSLIVTPDRLTLKVGNSDQLVVTYRVIRKLPMFQAQDWLRP